ALLVTHSEHEAQLMADHIGVVKMGQYQIKKATHPT
ncbi:ABC transporter ATP-binding protein, partial [Enterobacter kobei]|nr:ABC transporter ATP-binding protein [Enterobacter kobei]